MVRSLQLLAVTYKNRAAELRWYISQLSAEAQQSVNNSTYAFCQSSSDDDDEDDEKWGREMVGRGRLPPDLQFCQRKRAGEEVYVAKRDPEAWRKMVISLESITGVLAPSSSTPIEDSRYARDSHQGTKGECETDDEMEDFIWVTPFVRRFLIAFSWPHFNRLILILFLD